jgi:hypothetical protein
MVDLLPSCNSDSTHRTAVAAVVCGVLALAVVACLPHGETATSGAAVSVRVLSWNVSSDAFVRDPAAFRALVHKARADILLLDEVAPSTSEVQIRGALAGLQSDSEGEWYIEIGRSGGRQRGVIVSRWPLERLPQLADMAPYPESERRRLHERMAAANDLNPGFTMDDGIPMIGAVVLAGERRLLVVTTDLQCCGNDPGGWQEDRRWVETRELRHRVQQVLEHTNVDGILVAGDFNLVSTPLPLIYASGPYAPPHAGLIAAELYHLDGAETWTWDGRGTPFPSRVMDIQLYSPRTLELLEGYVLDSADLSPAEREQLGLEPEAAHGLSSHRPLVAEYVWR